MASSINEQASSVTARGFGTQTSGRVSPDTTAGGTAIPATAQTNRGWILVQVDPAETDTLYLGFGTVTATNSFAHLTGGESVFLPLGNGLALKGLSSSGTIIVQYLELAL